MEAEDKIEDETSQKNVTMEDTINQDFVRLSLIMPKEVWKMVTGKLQNKGHGTENLIKSSPFFHNLLASQRTTHLFEKVFPLVASSVWNEEGLEGLPVSEVLKCRAVCSKWNHAIDKLIPENFKSFGLEKRYMDEKTKLVRRPFRAMLKNETWFDNYLKQLQVRFNHITGPIKTASDFLRHFEQTHPGNQPKGRNPFIWGDLSLEVWNREEQSDQSAYLVHLKAISEVISKYGSHITNFTVTFNIDRRQMYENPYVTMWQNWFSNMNNLKKLEVKSYSGKENLERNFNFAEGVSSEFRHLEELITGGLPVEMLNMLILKSSQISKLTLWGIQESYEFFTYPLPNLRELEMQYNAVEIIEMLRSPQVQLPLEDLFLTYKTRNGESTDGCALASVFQLIQEKFAKTLLDFYFVTEVMDSAVDGPVWQACKNCRLDLPNLKYLSIFFSGSLVCLDFLLPMKDSLEQLRIFYGYEFDVMREFKEKVARETIVEFVGFETKILDSNIWRIFTKLKEIELKRMHHTNYGFQLRTSRIFTREHCMDEQ